ncbi:hypothetical protein ACH4TQ_16080 [Streptomyces sp. NPDC021218]|uniref:hypothetical protein n=1 Tax=unclassified Streptomyces TaxID=2593676 RepID=UPI0036D036E2
MPGALITSAAALSKIVLAPVLSYLVVAHGWRSAFAVGYSRLEDGSSIRRTPPASGYALTFQVLGAVAVVGAITALLTVNPPRDARRVLASRIERAGRTGA